MLLPFWELRGNPVLQEFRALDVSGVEGPIPAIVLHVGLNVLNAWALRGKILANPGLKLHQLN